ncbi:MAG: hypothetical protein RHS_4835 [Robinsoniella sp. RHS]|nr:MAG: hypothetical protein RHS_4835 [Robinsoniella sp. RHS]
MIDVIISYIKQKTTGKIFTVKVLCNQSESQTHTGFYY